MATTTGSDGAVVAWRQERRAVIRTMHPDRGGSAEEFGEALAEVDRRHAMSVTPPVAEAGTVWVVHTRSRGLKRRLRVLLRLVNASRARLPRRVPGSKRFIRL